MGPRSNAAAIARRFVTDHAELYDSARGGQQVIPKRVAAFWDFETSDSILDYTCGPVLCN